MLDPKAEITLCWKPNYEPFLLIRSHLSIKRGDWSVTHDYAKQPTAQLNPPDKLKNPALMTKWDESHLDSVGTGTGGSSTNTLSSLCRRRQVCILCQPLLTQILTPWNWSSGKCTGNTTFLLGMAAGSNQTLASSLLTHQMSCASRQCPLTREPCEAKATHQGPVSLKICCYFVQSAPQSHWSLGNV